MKIDRILEIIIYLINHDNVPASFLAERFHVSVRTIQRDITSISLIGIPVYATGGKQGGYSILPTFKMKNTEIRSEEQQIIIKALESLSTSYTNDTLKGLIEKYNAIIEKEGGQKIFWDFGVTKENQKVQDINALLEQAIEKKSYIRFQYRNANGEMSTPTVEPLAIHYKWYAWYLFAYSAEKIGENRCRIFIDVPAKERLWKALLLSFGDRVKVVGPESYRDELVETAQKFLSNYDI